jgi:hypothetical protein
MQTRGPGHSSKETEPCGQAHLDSVQTGEARTSLSQLGSQHRRVVGGGSSQVHSRFETDPDGQVQPDSVQIGSAGRSPRQLPEKILHGSPP